jgi:hypothetical protein
MLITRKNPRDPDSPFLNREALGRGKSFKERFPNADFSRVTVVCVPDEPVKPSARTAKEAKTNVPLASDLVTQRRQTGPDWPELADKILRSGLKKLKPKAA